MSIQQDDLDLLLSLQDRVLETPPASPSSSSSSHHRPQSPDYGSSSPRRKTTGKADMSVFRDSVGDYLEDVPTRVNKIPKLKSSNKSSNDVHVERFSGLRIRNISVSDDELNFSETRFIRLSAIRNILAGDTVSGCWATAGVLIEHGSDRLSSNGKKYCIWKLGCLDEKVTSVFLFGDAYTKNCKEETGTVFALFNAKVRKDAEGNGFSLSVFSSSQIEKMGTSVDYAICKGKRKDGAACNVVVNKCRGIYCNYHKSNTSQKFTVMRTELKGGNLRTAFRNTLRPEGVYMFDPLAERINLKKPAQPLKLFSVDGLKKALSNAGKVTTNARSQGIRFLTEVTDKICSKEPNKVSILPNKHIPGSEKRLSSSSKSGSDMSNKQTEAKRRKVEKPAEKTIELEIYSSDEE